jgi:antitoxin MazE
MIQITTIKKWGNSYGIRLPKQYLEKMFIHEGDLISLTLTKNSIIVTKNTSSILDSLCKKINAKNRHSHVLDTPTPKGKEVW